MVHQKRRIRWIGTGIERGGVVAGVIAIKNMEEPMKERDKKKIIKNCLEQEWNVEGWLLSKELHHCKRE